jgi:serine protease Do
MIGETVIAIGNPLGYQNTCTTGVLSALNRKLEFRGGLAYDQLIQIDAPINPGSSGGPLLNVAGELIGINTAIRADAQGIGFAIPVDLLTEDLPRLLDFERLNRVVFGLRVAQQHAPGGDRIVVAAVEPSSPAAAAGCKVGDRLEALNGRKLVQLPEYQIAMLQAKPGQTVRLRCRRDDRRVEAAIGIRARPKPDGAALAEGLFGLELKEITPELARQLRLPVEAGLLVTGVEGGSPAERLGLRRDDIVFQMGRWYTPDLEMVGAILEDMGPGTMMQIGIIRGRVRAWGAIKARKPPATTRPAPRLRI